MKRITLIVLVVGFIFISCDIGNGTNEEEFVVSINESVYNDIITLGLIGEFVSSSNPSVTTADIISGKIRITSVSAGSAVISVFDNSEPANEAKINVNVSKTGSITIGTIVPYTSENAGGTFTLTDIPPEYFGKYAILTSIGYGFDGPPPPEYNAPEVMYYGGNNINIGTGTFVAVLISNESVSIPVWYIDDGDVFRYEGSDTIVFGYASGINGFTVIIYNTQIVSEEDVQDYTYAYWNLSASSITFINGNTKKSWEDGNVIND